ncbi:transporter associated domain-containing protein [Buchnera aphidicola]|uniref:transporter associated domain-containing protein n=1 Tax=Buchnera aphidicola TaxID=9 RepID=UPI0031B85908
MNNKKQKNKENKKSFFSILLNQIFHDEPKNEEELLKLIHDSKENTLIDQNTGNMLEGIINITKQRIRDIMIPRSQMIVLKPHYTIDKCLHIIIKSEHSRFPVISKDNNYIKGILIAKDLLLFIKNKQKKFYIKNILRPAIIVPESKYVNNMLQEFCLNQFHMAIVIDEFGTVSGLITIEDILELIVVKINNTYYQKKKINIKKLNTRTFTIQAITKIEEFNKIFNTNFNKKEVNTIGDLVIKTCGYLPKIGDTININGYLFTIQLANNKQLIRLHVSLPTNSIN